MQLMSRDEPKMKLTLPATSHFRNPALTPLASAVPAAESAMARTAPAASDFAVSDMFRSPSWVGKYGRMQIGAPRLAPDPSSLVNRGRRCLALHAKVNRLPAPLGLHGSKPRRPAARSALRCHARRYHSPWPGS